MPTPQLMIDTIELLKANTTYALPAAAVQLSWQSGTGSAILVSIDGTNFSTLGTSTGLEVKTVNTAAIFLKTSTPGTRIVAKPSPALIIPDPLTIGRINITDQLHLTNSSKITATNTAGTGDMTVVSFGPTDAIKIGDDTTVSGIQLHAINTIGLWAGGGAFKWATDISGAWFPGATNAYDIGLAASNHVRNIYLDGAVIIGTNPATTGAIRLANNTSIVWRNAANTADNVLISGAAGELSLGDNGKWKINSTGTLYPFVDAGCQIGSAAVRPSSIFISDFVIIGTPTAQSGAIRLANNASIYWRNAANDADVQGLWLASDNNLYVSASLLPRTTGTFVLGTAGSQWLAASFSVHIAIGTNPATTGAIRLAKDTGLNWRNLTGTGDLSPIWSDGQTLYLGRDTASLFVQATSSLSATPTNTVDLGSTSNAWRSAYLGTSLSIGTNPATTGAIRLANNQGIRWRNSANTADLAPLNDYEEGTFTPTLFAGGGTPTYTTQ